MQGKFKNRGQHILNRNSSSMRSFLEVQPGDKDIPVPDKGNPENVRLHVHIRKDLADQLFEMVYRLKKDHSIRNRSATQRVIIEEALADYFKKHAY